MKSAALLVLFATVGTALAAAQGTLRNDRYSVEVTSDGVAVMNVAGMPPQRVSPEFVVLWSETDPLCTRNPSHPNYPAAPRNAVRWQNPTASLNDLNAWIGSPDFKAVTGMAGVVRDNGRKREWEYRDAQGKVKVRVTGGHAFDTTRPFDVGHRVVMKAVRTITEPGRVRWEYATQAEFTFAAELALADGDHDPVLAFTLTPKRDAWFSVAFTGTPAVALAETLPVPQECDARGHKQFNFVMSEADLHLPRAHVATKNGNVALVADPRECRFRLPTIADSRFGFMLQYEEGRLKPVLLAPLLGGPESKMRAGDAWRFTFCCVARAGDWKETFAHIARDIHGFRDQRDNSGPGSLNATLERVMDFLADRNGRNHALWDPQQKYFDYFNDKTGVFKPFSPLYGLGAAIVTDDEEFFRTRARPAVEYALSRKTLIFAPYESADNKQANSAGRAVGAPCINATQLGTLDELFQNRTPAFRGLTGKKPENTNRKPSPQTEEGFFDLLERANATRTPQDIAAAREAAYHNAAKLSLYPAPPDLAIAVDRGGKVPVHLHSFGRHKNIWGFPEPQPLRVPEQTVPAWRISRLGLPGIAYPIEYWMNTHGAMMRIAALAHDDLLRDIARWGMVGRFGNFPGDNRSQDSLVPELPDAVEGPPWQWNFATVNAGHAWDFVGAVLDFLVSDAFERSHGAIDFPALSAAGSSFRVGIYGGKPGKFYDDENVRLWLPRGLVTSDNRQLDWLAGHGNGQCYLALWNQSAQEQKANITLDPALVQCSAQEARAWRDNAPASPIHVNDNHLAVTIAPKGIIAFAIPAKVKPRLQAKLYANQPALDTPSHTEITAPFGKVHAMLLRAGRELTSAFVYTEALPEQVIAARLWWRQGAGDWQAITDDIYPYEFSPELRDDAGAFQCVLEIEKNQRQVGRSPLITLGTHPSTELPGTLPFPRAVAPELFASPTLSDDFVAYFQHAANGHDFGLHSDGRYYPYSTPLGRRIAARQLVWDNALFAKGCTREEGEQHLRGELGCTLIVLKRFLAARTPKVDFEKLEQRQQETLLDLAHTETVEALRPELITAVLARDWMRMAKEHLYIRYAGHAPDHPRNKAFAQRWNVQ